MREIRRLDEFSDWLSGLRDRQAKARILLRIDRAEKGNYGDCKPVGDGVSEMRIHYGAGYRVYFIERGQTLTILLAGGTKSTQAKDIKRAKELAQHV